MRPLAPALFVASFVAALGGSARADDWPQWLGPTRDGVWAEAGVLERLPPGGPKKLWSTPVGGGYSGPAVAAGRVYVCDYAKTAGEAVNDPQKAPPLTGRERLLCLDAKTGAKLWEYAYDCAYKISYPAGPRATPTVSGGKVYSVGAMGNLVCCDAATGSLVWSKDYKIDYKAPAPVWGFAGHPLVYGQLLICTVGGDGSVAVAFDKETGAEVWRALSAPEPGYSAPSVINAGGVDQLLVWHAASVNSLNPLTGAKYWSVPLKPSYGMAIMMPRRAGEFLFAGGIGNQGVTLRLDPAKPAVTEVYRGTKSNAVYPVNSPPLVEGGTMYAVDQAGEFRAVALDTGKRLWGSYRPVTGADQDGDFRGLNSGTAFGVRNGATTFLFAETGELILAKLTPEKYEEVGRAKLVEPTGEAFGRKVVWSCPAFAGRCIFVRNDKEIACFSLAAE